MQAVALLVDFTWAAGPRGIYTRQRTMSLGHTVVLKWPGIVTKGQVRMLTLVNVLYEVELGHEGLPRYCTVFDFAGVPTDHNYGWGMYLIAA